MLPVQRKLNPLCLWAGPASDSQEQLDQPAKRRKFGKDPTVNTSFLPDKERDELARLERERLKQEWIAEQEVIKSMHA